MFDQDKMRFILAAVYGCFTLFMAIYFLEGFFLFLFYQRSLAKTVFVIPARSNFDGAFHSCGRNHC